jgi:D-sedoheptulose 7-phosphate isomerase
MNYFPDRTYDNIGGYLDSYFDRLEAAVATVDRKRLQAAADLIVEAVERDRTIFSCGNGGSAAIANHLACDCMKGARTGATIRPRVVSLSATVELITAIGNDLGYDDVFSFQLSSLARSGDVLIAISSSGDSPNIVKALDWAKANDVRSVAMTGFTGGRAGKIADIWLHADERNYGIVEDVHQSFMHVLAQYLRHRRLIEPQLLGELKF